ncbi:hypothetical protein [Amycolatopsis samaneae]|uniref:SH3 domain-containing protein n=1 Tax=Amycolatopsis samaneae TaxID=664691 RepID=A0ABW5G879_9PSEU
MRKTAALSVLAAATALTTGILLPGTALASTPAAVTQAAGPQPARFDGDGVRIHEAPNDGSKTLGLGYRNHAVTLYCTTNTAPAFGRITDLTTGVTGYARTGWVVQTGSGPSVGFC